MESLKQTLMSRDQLTEHEAEEQISMARADLIQRLEGGELPYDICEEFFGLEPDYLMDLLD